MNPHQVTKDFEAALCEYTGAPFAVAVNSCTSALLLACAWFNGRARSDTGQLVYHGAPGLGAQFWAEHSWVDDKPPVEIPRRTYVSVPQSIIHAGGRATFRDEEWSGAYQLKPYPIWDSARLFTSGMYKGRVGVVRQGWRDDAYVTRLDFDPRDMSGAMVCVSFHWSKTLGIQQGGAILHDDPVADAWLRRARFDGRQEGVAPKDDTFDMVGWHAYMSPEVAAEGLVRLSFLPRHNAPLPNDEYPDLSTFEVFR